MSPVDVGFPEVPGFGGFGINLPKKKKMKKKKMNLG